ncbi:MAG: hypothetical protein RQ899_01735 [Pseudomonadales bacterium]|nr:hypothetical protein [Pseudomonadales bacterium]
MTVKRIEAAGQLLAIYLTGDDWPQGLAFYSDDADYVQVGTWNYERGKTLLAHRHKKALREAERTQEVIFVKQGAVKADIYDGTDILVETVQMRAGDVLILLNGGHGYHILEDDTQVLEIKNGPYPGPEADRERLKK